MTVTFGRGFRVEILRGDGDGRAVVRRPTSSRVETISEANPYTGGALAFSDLGIALNNGSWSCGLGNGTVVVTFAHRATDEEPEDTARSLARVWIRRPEHEDWVDVTSAIASVARDLDGSFLKPVVAADPADPDVFVWAAVETELDVNDRGEEVRIPARVRFFRIRGVPDASFTTYTWELVDASVLGVIGLESPEDLSIACAPDGFAVATFLGRPEHDPTGPPHLKVVWEVFRGIWYGAQLYADADAEAVLPSVAAGDAGVVVAWTVEATASDGSVTRTVLAAPITRSTGTMEISGVDYAYQWLAVPEDVADVTVVEVAGNGVGDVDTPAWDVNVVWVVDETFVVGFQTDFQETGTELLPSVSVSDDGGFSWSSPPKEVAGSTEPWSYFVSLAALDGSIAASWESRDDRTNAATRCDACASFTTFGRGGLFAAADDEGPATTDRDFATFPCSVLTPLDAARMAVVFLAYDGVAGSETRLAFQARIFEV